MKKNGYRLTSSAKMAAGVGVFMLSASGVSLAAGTVQPVETAAASSAAATPAASAVPIFVRAVETKTMPLGNLTGMTDDERAVLGRWIAQGAPVPAPHGGQ